MKRITVILLALVMVLALVPTVAMAASGTASTPAELTSALSGGRFRRYRQDYDRYGLNRNIHDQPRRKADSKPRGQGLRVRRQYNI